MSANHLREIDGKFITTDLYLNDVLLGIFTRILRGLASCYETFINSQLLTTLFVCVSYKSNTVTDSTSGDSHLFCLSDRYLILAPVNVLIVYLFRLLS